MMAPAPARALTALCRAIGARVPMWTQGTGGNVSLKNGAKAPVLYIKASGVRLDRVGAGGGLDGIAAVRLDEFAKGAEGLARAADPERAYAALVRSSTILEPGFGRPSMETGFHALLPGRWVIHLHSLAAMLMAHEARRDRVRFLRFWADASGPRLQMLGAESPGWGLLDRVRSLPSAEVYLLENHGVILQGDDGAVSLSLWQDLEQRFLGAWGHQRLLERARLPSEALRDAVGAAAPLRILFPDTAVFLDLLRAVLLPAGQSGGEPLWRLAPQAWSEPGSPEWDVAEIWVAQQLLLEACADLRELPEPIATTVATLPLELFRRGLPDSG
jgi:ribulose-5-phosphate 4-epimerase/fuculose-1-phosphate aldolase